MSDEAEQQRLDDARRLVRELLDNFPRVIAHIEASAVAIMVERGQVVAAGAARGRSLTVAPACTTDFAGDPARVGTFTEAGAVTPQTAPSKT